VTISGTERRLARHLEVAIFSVIQESLLNAVQHGHPSQVDVAVTYGESGLAITVNDNGQGFDATDLSSGDPKRQLVGLASMHQLVSALSGSFVVRSEPGRGTTVAAEIPVPEAHAGAE
jgi:signal transduction histidine kinase